MIRLYLVVFVLLKSYLGFRLSPNISFTRTQSLPIPTFNYGAGVAVGAGVGSVYRVN